MSSAELFPGSRSIAPHGNGTPHPTTAHVTRRASRHRSITEETRHEEPEALAPRQGSTSAGSNKSAIRSSTLGFLTTVAGQTGRHHSIDFSITPPGPSLYSTTSWRMTPGKRPRRPRQHTAVLGTNQRHPNTFLRRITAFHLHELDPPTAQEKAGRASEQTNHHSRGHLGHHGPSRVSPRRNQPLPLVHDTRNGHQPRRVLAHCQETPGISAPTNSSRAQLTPQRLPNSRVNKTGRARQRTLRWPTSKHPSSPNPLPRAPEAGVVVLRRASSYPHLKYSSALRSSPCS